MVHHFYCNLNAPNLPYKKVIKRKMEDENVVAWTTMPEGKKANMWHVMKTSCGSSWLMAACLPLFPRPSHRRPHALETPNFSLETPDFYSRPQDFFEDPKFFYQRPQISIGDPEFNIGDSRFYRRLHTVI